MNFDKSNRRSGVELQPHERRLSGRSQRLIKISKHVFGRAVLHHIGALERINDFRFELASCSSEMETAMCIQRFDEISIFKDHLLPTTGFHALMHWVIFPLGSLAFLFGIQKLGWLWSYVKEWLT